MSYGLPKRSVQIARAGLRRTRNAARREAGNRFAATLGQRPDAAPYRPAPNPLSEYFSTYEEGPGIVKPANYFEVYHRHLAKFVGRPVTVVEIGVYAGGGILMWQHYFGPECRIYGVDIQEDCRRHQSDTVEIIIGDQADPAFWSSFRERVPSVDVVLDDGGHRTHQQIPTLEGLLPYMADGGVYICEDIGGVDNGFQSYVDGFTRNIHATGERTTGFQQAVHSVHQYPFMVVIEKPTSPVSSFADERRGTEWAAFTV